MNATKSILSVTSNVLAGAGLSSLLAAGFLLLAASGCDKGAAPSAEQTSEAAGKAATPGPTDRAPSGSNLNEDRYELGAPSEPIAVGQETEVTLTITAADGLKINQEFPWSLSFSDAEGVELAQTDFNKEQLKLGQDTASIPLKLSASSPGEHSLEAVGNFSVCNDTQCYVIRNQKLAFNIEAKGIDAKEMKAKEAKKPAPSKVQ
jgi:hypothetical protein